MSTSLKTLSKPQRALLEAIRDGHVKVVDQSYGLAVRQDTPGEWRSKTVNAKTWDTLRHAGLVQHERPRFRQSSPVTLTEAGRRVLAGEAVNTANSLEFTIRLGNTEIVRRVPLPAGWYQYPEGRERAAGAARAALLAEAVTVTWVESEQQADTAEVSR